MYSALLRRLLGLAIFTAAFAPAAGAQSYVVTDLGTLGGNASYGFGVNDNGVIVGNSNVKTTTTDYQAFSYSSGSIKNLGTLGSGVNSEAFAVNNSGVVVGDSNTQGSGNVHAFASTSSGLADLGTFGGNQSFAYGINNAGVVAGYADLAGVGTGAHAFTYDTTKTGATKTDLGTLGGKFSYAFGINDNGIVIGASNPVNTASTHAFIDSNNQMTDIGTLGGLNSYGRGINKDGLAVGYSDTTVSGQQIAFSYTVAGGLQNLGTLVGTASSRAYAVNNNGDIVGNASTTNGAMNIAFLYSNGSMVSLNSLAPASNWNLQYAYGINNNGVIIGYGVNPQGKVHAYSLARATPAPSSLLLALCGAGGVGFSIRRKRP